MSKVPQKIPENRPRQVEIDQGFRAWYESCPCCLSEAYPDVRRRLDDAQVIRRAQEAARQ